MDSVKLDSISPPMIILLIIVISLIVFIIIIEPRIFKRKLKNNNEHGSSKFADKKEIKANFDKEDLNILASVSPINYEKIEKVEENAFSRSLIKQVEYYIDKDPSISNSILSLLNPNLGIDTLTDLVSPILKESYERKLEYLYEINPVVRVCMILEDINEELKIVEFESMIEEHLSKNLDDYQKNFLLQEKLKVVKEELGISYDKDEEYINLKEKIDKVKCPLSVKNKLNEELKKYESTSVNSPECSIIRSYIDLLLNLPWNKSTTDNKNLILAKKILDETHYGLNDVKDRIVEYLALRTRTKNTNSSVICLVGPPGVGKTTLCKSIAKAMNRKYVKTGEERQTDFINIVTYSKLAEFAEKYLKQGLQVCVCGRMQTRIYEDNNGQKRYITEIIAEEIDFADSPKKTDESVLYANTPVNSQTQENIDNDVISSGDDLPF